LIWKGKTVNQSVLVVEDEALVAEFVCALLSDRGFDATYDLTGEAALERLGHGEQPDLVLMDIHLGPGNLDGGAAARLINERHDIPVVFYSAREDAVTLAKTRETDCYGYVRKGSGSEEYLVRSIRAALHRHALTRDLGEALSIKEIREQEANHRIRNGFTMVRSFLQLKQQYAEVECDLSDVIARIEALAKLHELMSAETDAGAVELQALLEGTIDRVFAAAPFPVKSSCNVGDLSLRYQDARALSLVVAELAINAVKHSFSPEGENVFSLSSVASPPTEEDPEAPEGVDIVVDMEGFPIDEAVDLDAPQSQGLRIIHALVRQIGGRLEIRRRPTPRFTIGIPGDRLLR
jgi:two-component sensor histidine kinase